MKKKCVLYLVLLYVSEAILLSLREFRGILDEKWGFPYFSCGVFLFYLIIFIILLLVPSILSFVLMNVCFSFRIKSKWRKVFEYILYIWLLLPDVAYIFPIILESKKCAITSFSDLFLIYTFNVPVFLLFTVKLGTIILVRKQIELCFSQAIEKIDNSNR